MLSLNRGNSVSNVAHLCQCAVFTVIRIPRRKYKSWLKKPQKHVSSVSSLIDLHKHQRDPFGDESGRSEWDVTQRDCVEKECIYNPANQLFSMIHNQYWTQTIQPYYCSSRISDIFPNVQWTVGKCSDLTEHWHILESIYLEIYDGHPWGCTPY